MKIIKIKRYAYFLILNLFLRFPNYDLRKKFIKYNSFLKENQKNYLRQINIYFLLKNLLPVIKNFESKPLYIDNINSVVSKEEYINNKKKVSILITSFNQKRLLKYSIDSIINQTYKNIEIVIVDDASTDDSQSILKAFYSKYEFIKIIYQKKNRGTYVSKNIALHYATGDYITFHDSDDWAHPQRIQEQIKAIEKYKSSASISKLVRIKPNGELYSKYPNEFERICMVSLMVKKEVIDEIGYFMKKRTGADTEYYERVKNFAKNSCTKVDKVLTFCAKRHKSLTTCPTEGVWETKENPKRVNYMSRWRKWHKGFMEKNKKPYVKFDLNKYDYEIYE